MCFCLRISQLNFSVNADIWLYSIYTLPNTLIVFQDDPFSSSDPFGSSFGSSTMGSKQLDAFDPFGTSSSKPQVRCS